MDVLEDLKLFHERNPEAISALKMAISLMESYGKNTIVTKTPEEAERVRGAFHGKRELLKEQKERLREVNKRIEGLVGRHSFTVTIDTEDEEEV